MTTQQFYDAKALDNEWADLMQVIDYINTENLSAFQHYVRGDTEQSGYLIKDGKNVICLKGYEDVKNKFLEDLRVLANKQLEENKQKFESL